MPDRRVWIAQCLCGPNRHAIAALAGEVNGEAGAQTLLPTLRDSVAELRRSGVNPWCAICGAEEPGWRYEIGRTRWRTMQEAKPELAKVAAGFAAANLLYGTHGPKKPGRVN